MADWGEGQRQTAVSHLDRCPVDRASAEKRGPTLVGSATPLLDYSVLPKGSQVKGKTTAVLSTRTVN
jgi:hypothetical protein